MTDLDETGGHRGMRGRFTRRAGHGPCAVVGLPLVCTTLSFWCRELVRGRCVLIFCVVARSLGGSLPGCYQASVRQRLADTARLTCWKLELAVAGRRSNGGTRPGVTRPDGGLRGETTPQQPGRACKATRLNKPPPSQVSLGILHKGQ